MKNKNIAKRKKVAPQKDFSQYHKNGQQAVLVAQAVDCVSAFNNCIAVVEKAGSLLFAGKLEEAKAYLEENFFILEDDTEQAISAANMLLQMIPKVQATVQATAKLPAFNPEAGDMFRQAAGNLK